MKRSWLWIALVLSVGVNIGVLATIGATRWRQQPRWERPRPGGVTVEPGAVTEGLADRLDLEGERRERFLEIQRRLFEETRQHRQTLEWLRGELRQELMSGKPDPGRIDELLAELAEVSTAMDRALVESVLASREVLSPEQQRRFFHMLDRARGARGGRFHQGLPPRRRARDR